MILTKENDIIKGTIEFNGLLSAAFEHKIADTKARLTYTGPVITPEVWFPILSFFRWTYQTTHSESQVRLFLNPKKKCWVAWAFPQEARTGMSAKEIDCEEKKQQRAGLPDAQDLISFGTIHHHCSMGAFQSGTDHSGTGNGDGEKDQDGLHITIGKIDHKVQHDLHARFYVQKVEFKPDMSWFWDIGDCRKMIPPAFLSDVAIFQMTQNIDMPFPEQWKKNLIEVKPVTTTYRGGLGYEYGDGADWGGYQSPHLGNGSKPSFLDRVECACEDVLEELMKMNAYPDVESLKTELEVLWESKLLEEIIAAGKQYELDVQDILRDVWFNIDKYLGDALGDKKKKKGKKGKGKNDDKPGATDIMPPYPHTLDDPWGVYPKTDKSGQFRVECKARFVTVDFDSFEEAKRQADLRNDRELQKLQRDWEEKYGGGTKDSCVVGGRQCIWDKVLNMYVDASGNRWSPYLREWIPSPALK